MKTDIIILLITLVVYSCASQNAQTNLNPLLQDYQQEILGEWVLETESNTKIVFTEQGQLKRYYNNVLKSTDQYEITHSCDGENLSDGFFLKTTNSDGNIFCAYIEGVNFENNNLLSLMTKNQGKIVVYIRP